MTDRSPGEGRYARVEREQRWLVARLPADARRTAEIRDRYISGSRLRLRRMDTDHGVMFKLGQKVRANEADPEVVKLTNLYLSAEEYDIVAGLPATEVRKSRWQVSHDGIRMVIDEFHGRHRGLLLAEVELAPGEPPRPAPPFAVRDVTSEDRFSGGALARASNDEVEGLLREVRNAD